MHYEVARRIGVNLTSRGFEESGGLLSTFEYMFDGFVISVYFLSSHVYDYSVVAAVDITVYLSLKRWACETH